MWLIIRHKAGYMRLYRRGKGRRLGHRDCSWLFLTQNRSNHITSRLDLFVFTVSTSPLRTDLDHLRTSQISLKTINILPKYSIPIFSCLDQLDIFRFFNCQILEKKISSANPRDRTNHVIWFDFDIFMKKHDFISYYKKTRKKSRKRTSKGQIQGREIGS